MKLIRKLWHNKIIFLNNTYIQILLVTVSISPAIYVIQQIDPKNFQLSLWGTVLAATIPAIIGIFFYSARQDKKILDNLSDIFIEMLEYGKSFSSEIDILLLHIPGCFPFLNVKKLKESHIWYKCLKPKIIDYHILLTQSIPTKVFFRASRTEIIKGKIHTCNIVFHSLAWEMLEKNIITLSDPAKIEKWRVDIQKLQAKYSYNNDLFELAIILVYILRSLSQRIAITDNKITEIRNWRHGDDNYLVYIINDFVDKNISDPAQEKPLTVLFTELHDKIIRDIKRTKKGILPKLNIPQISENLDKCKSRDY